MGKLRRGKFQEYVTLLNMIPLVGNLKVCQQYRGKVLKPQSPSMKYQIQISLVRETLASSVTYKVNQIYVFRLTYVNLKE